MWIGHCMESATLCEKLWKTQPGEKTLMGFQGDEILVKK